VLVLSRKLGERLVIGDNVVVEVVGIHFDRVRLGILAPKEVPVHRQEVFDAIHGPGATERAMGRHRSVVVPPKPVCPPVPEGGAT
jgi:carbon storage regulator